MTQRDYDFVDHILELANNLSKVRGKEIHAVELYRSYLCFHPDDGEVWLFLGSVLKDTKCYVEAQDAFLKAEKFVQEQYKSYVYSELGSLFSDYLSPIKAQKWFQLAAEHPYPSPGLILISKGTNYSMLGSFEKALECFDEAIAMDAFKRKDEAYLNKGLVLRTMGKYDEAISDFKKSLKLDSSCEMAKSSLLGMAGMDKTLQKVENIRSLKENKNGGKLGKNLNEFLDEILQIAKEEYEGESREIHAVELLKEYLSLRPDDPEAWRLYGDCLKVLGKSKEGMASLKRALELAPESDKGQILANLGKLCEAYRSPLEAEEWYKRATELKSEWAGSIWVERGKNLFVLGEYKKSLKCFEEVTDSYPEEEEDALLNMGLVLRAMGKYDEAISLFEETLNINPNNYEAKIALDGFSGIEETLKLCSKMKSMKN